MERIDDKEFCRFRSAVSRMQRVVVNSLLIVAAILGMLRWYRDIEWNSYSMELLIFFIVIVPAFIFLPRISYMLTRHVVGNWYKKEFGNGYSEYSKNENMAQAKELIENEI